MRVEPTYREHCRVEWQLIVRFRIMRQNPEELSGIEQGFYALKTCCWRCAAECAVRFEPVRVQCGLFCYFDKVLPCGLGFWQVVDFIW
jgi:hypothetical protein